MKLLKTLRFTAIAEGVSYLSFALTMPLKYIWQIRLPNLIVGQIHGILFIAFCSLVIFAAYRFKWKARKTAILLISSIIPFGTFWSEKKYLRSSKVITKLEVEVL